MKPEPRFLNHQLWSGKSYCFTHPENFLAIKNKRILNAIYREKISV